MFKAVTRFIRSVRMPKNGALIRAMLWVMAMMPPALARASAFSLKASRVCTFSPGGHLLAAVSGKDIHVFSSVNFGLRAALKGHTGQITAMAWSSDDRALVSCADDGSVYQWDVADSGRRMHELVIKSCAYNDVVVVSEDGKRKKKNSGGESNVKGGGGNGEGGKAEERKSSEPRELVTYAVGSDKTIKQIAGSTLVREIDLHTLNLSSLSLSFDERVLFSGSTAGRVQSFK